MAVKFGPKDPGVEAEKWCNYYPFGMQMGDRTYPAGDNYRFGYNGMMGDKEWSSQGNSYMTEFRMYDPRLGRWLSIDPIINPSESPYVGFGNNPIYYVDPSGTSNKDPIDEKPGRTTKILGQLDITNGAYLLNGVEIKASWASVVLAKLGKFFREVAQGAKKAIVHKAQNEAAFYGGVNNAVLSNLSLDVIPYQHNDVFGIRRLDNSFEYGQMVGNALSEVAGIATTIAGATTTFVGGAFGIVTSPTGLGAVAGITVSAAGVTTTVYGAAITKISFDRIRDMMEGSAGGGGGGGSDIDKYGHLTAQEFISKFRKGSIKSKFPGEFLDTTINDIKKLAKTGNVNARRAMKLLKDGRFRKR